MTDPYRMVFHPSFRVRMKAVSERAANDRRGADAKVVIGALDGIAVLRQGRERKFQGQRLGYSSTHYDLRDCAEIKIAVTKEYTRSGKLRGPSHRMIYREYEPAPDDPRPIREVIAFEHRADGLPFAVAAAALNRTKGRAVDALKHLPAPKPAIGRNKDPHIEVTPPRLPLPPDIATALATAHRNQPGRVGEPVRAPQRPGRRPTRPAPALRGRQR